MLSRVEYRRLDATGLAGLVRRREVSAEEIIEAAILEIEALDGPINAVVVRGFEQARVKAAEVAVGGSESTALFAGVPFLGKDVNVEIEGFRTSYASRFFSGAPVATGDSRLVERWKQAGLIVLGRTNTPEFATEFTCEPELFGACRNPWNLCRTPGGSSGGAAAAVAAGMVPMAHGSDSGGSIRVPAACCGLFGFKPSAGVVATGSRFGPLVGGLNVDHVITRSVRDSASMLAATAGPEPWAPTPYRDFLVHPEVQRLDEQRPLLIGVTARSPNGRMPSAEMAEKLAEARRLVESLGHVTVDWQWPHDIDTARCATTIWAAEIAALIDDRSAMLGRRPADRDLGPVARSAYEWAQRQTAADVVRAREQMSGIRSRIGAAMDGLDLIMSPVTAELPLLVEDETGHPLVDDIEARVQQTEGFAPYTEIYNVTGQPAMSVPLFQDAGGLPIGVQFAGRVGSDRLMLALARMLEIARPWSERRPALSV